MNEKAGFSPADIDTGAVIVTGETAKKENAAEIVARLSDEAGKFVSAVAGPNLESMLGAMGSGAASRSREQQSTILNIDIGVRQDMTIWRIDPPVRYIMDQNHMLYQVGDIITREDRNLIVIELGKALAEVMKGPAISPITQHLMMTDNIDYSQYSVDEIMFSGGVSEMIYGESSAYDDIGFLLANYIRNEDFGIAIAEPESKIRATVIGAGSYSLSISGSTISWDKSLNFPLLNIPVLTVDARKENFSRDYVVNQISSAFTKFDMTEGQDLVALYFDDPIYARDMFLPDFVKAIEDALPNSQASKQLILLVFRTDVGGSIGMAMKRETTIQDNFICLDEIELQDGDWIDIGAPIGKGDVFPVTIKSLVFN
ncbi:MAG: ethanolamine ammonia-lyase reactivating factor EutA [Candidatus Kariarchaeaceae archaeon]|jgi:ethanolamine utilization protein EutA